MADPATLALIGVAISGAGAVASGVAQGQAANYQAAVARNNALIEKQNAAYSASAAASQAEQSGLQERGKQAMLRADIAANGLDVNSGTPADLQESERMIGRLNTATVTSNAAQQVYGYETKSTADTAQAGLDQSAADFAPVAGVINAAGTVLKNPTADSAISGAFDGSFNDAPVQSRIDAGLASTPSASLVSSLPEVGDDYAWMQGA